MKKLIYSFALIVVVLGCKSTKTLKASSGLETRMSVKKIIKNHTKFQSRFTTLQGPASRGERRAAVRVELDRPRPAPHLLNRRDRVRRREPPVWNRRSGQDACQQQPQVEHVQWRDLGGQRRSAHAWHRIRVQGGASAYLLLRRLVWDSILYCVELRPIDEET